MIKIIPLAPFFFFFSFFYHTMPLSFSFTLISSHLSSSLSQLRSLKLTHSPLSARLILNIATTEAQRHRPTNRPKPPISLKSMPPSTSDPRRRSKCLLVVMLAHGYWVPDWETHGARRSTPSTNPARQRYAYL